MTFGKYMLFLSCLFTLSLLIGCAPKKNENPPGENKTTFQKDSLDAKVSISIVGKEFQSASAADPKEYVVIIYRLVNNTNKTVKNVEADVIIYDEKGNEVKKVKINEVEQLIAGAEKQYKALYSYNAFSDKDVRFKGIDLKNMKIDSKVLQIVYEDGTMEK